MKSLTPHKKALDNTKIAFLGGLVVELILVVFPAVFDVVDPNKISDGVAKGGGVEKTILAPFVCMEWRGMGEGFYENYCNIFEYLFSFPQNLITLRLFVILLVASGLIYLSFYLYYKIKNNASKEMG